MYKRQAPFLRRVPALARSPQLRDILSRSPVPCGASPAVVFPFRTVILFSRCCPSMNYPKSTRCRATHCRIHEQQIKISVFKGKTDILPSPIEECHKEVEVARINKLLRSPCYFCIFMDKYRQAIKDYYATVPINLMFCALIICI